MAVLPPEGDSSTKPTSNYKGALPSEKFFTPKELNNLNMGRKPDMKGPGKKVVKEELFQFCYKNKIFTKEYF